MSHIRPGKWPNWTQKNSLIAPFIYGVCEHTQGYNPSPIEIIFGIQLVWVLIKVGIVNKPYPIRDNGQTGLRQIPYSPFIYGVCEHTQGYNSSPIAIIYGIQLVWVLIKVGIENEPYHSRGNGPTGLRKIPYKPLHKYQLRELVNTLKATIFTDRNYT